MQDAHTIENLLEHATVMGIIVDAARSGRKTNSWSKANEVADYLIERIERDTTAAQTTLEGRRPTLAFVLHEVRNMKSWINLWVNI